MMTLPEYPMKGVLVTINPPVDIVLYKSPLEPWPQDGWHLPYLIFYKCYRLIQMPEMKEIKVLKLGTSLYYKPYDRLKRMNDYELTSH